MPSVWVQPFAVSSHQAFCCGVMVNDTWVEAAGSEIDPLEPGELARRLTGGRRVVQVQLGDVAAGPRPVLVTVADTCTSCVPSTVAGLICRLLNANWVYDSPNPNGNNGVRLFASYQR